MALDEGKCVAAYDLVLGNADVAAVFGYGPGSDGAKSQAKKFCAAVNSGSMANLRSIHKAKNAGQYWDTFVETFAQGYGDPAVKDKLNAFKSALL